MTKLLAAGVVILGITACEFEDPCAEYVAYMCDCHGDDEGFDCDTLRATYADPDADLQEQCVIDLDDQQAEDEAAGVCVAA